jgi:hypothetical protein
VKGSERRTSDLHIRLTPAEAQEVYEQARDDGRSMANWMVRVIRQRLAQLRMEAGNGD